MQGLASAEGMGHAHSALPTGCLAFFRAEPLTCLHEPHFFEGNLWGDLVMSPVVGAMLPTSPTIGVRPRIGTRELRCAFVCGEPLRHPTHVFI